MLKVGNLLRDKHLETLQQTRSERTAAPILFPNDYFARSGIQSERLTLAV
jgi:hypothetical protein